MADKSKAAKELVELSGDQAGHAAKNLAAAGEKAVEELLPQIPMGEEGFAFALRVSNKTIVAGSAVLGVVAGVRVGKRVWELKKARDAKKELKKESPVAAVPPRREAS
jgi:hypothetical protein